MLKEWSALSAVTRPVNEQSRRQRLRPQGRCSASGREAVGDSELQLTIQAGLGRVTAMAEVLETHVVQELLHQVHETAELIAVVDRETEDTAGISEPRARWWRCP